MTDETTPTPPEPEPKPTSPEPVPEPPQELEPEPESSSGPPPTPQSEPGPDPEPAGRRLAQRWRASYGASPWHFVVHLAGIALIAWALSQSFDARYSKAAVNLAIWMVAGAVIHDGIALPLYVVGDRTARWLWAPIGRRLARSGVRRVPGNGHVRVPLVMSAVMLLVFLPNIQHRAPIGHRLSTGLAEQPDYLGRWIAITVGLFAISLLIYGLRLTGAAAAARRASPR